MHRLLQGEVGSGKTVIALRAMLQVVDAGGQAVLLAPTEVLAQQHLPVDLQPARAARPGRAARRRRARDQADAADRLAGAPARRRALLEAASGEAGIVIGTHALLEDRVQFADLGLVGGRRAAPVRRRAARRAAGQGRGRPAARAGDDRHPDPADGRHDRLRRPGRLHADRAAGRALADRTHVVPAAERPHPRPDLAAAARGGRRRPPGLRGLPAHRRRRAGRRTTSPRG